MFRKQFETLVSALHANTRAAQRQVEEAGELNARLHDLDKTLNDGLAELVKTKIALMTGMERKRYDETPAPLEVKLPTQDINS